MPNQSAPLQSTESAETLGAEAKKPGNHNRSMQQLKATASSNET
jgi:hypothetical protein